jgi:hypothetical protein
MFVKSDEKNDVTTEQIIYISYDADEKTGDGIVHILDQNLVKFTLPLLFILRFTFVKFYAIFIKNLS